MNLKQSRFIKVIFKIPYVDFIFFLGFSFIYYKDSLFLMIAGDDVEHYLHAPRSIISIIELFSDVVHFRPVPKIFFTLYTLVPFNLPIFHGVSLLLLSFATYLFYIFLIKYVKIEKLIAFIAGLVFMTSHVMFYLVYTLSGIGDILFIIFFWGSVLCFYSFVKKSEIKNFVLSLVFFLLAMLTKEIFISILILISFIALANFKKRYLKYLLAFWVPTVLFFIMKFLVYDISDPVYGYTFDLKLLIENIIHFSLWTINYRHGWQMGMPYPETTMFFILVILNCILILLSVTFILKKNKNMAGFFVIWAFAGLLPFYFLNRVLVYYLDISLMALISLVAFSLQNISIVNRKARYLLLILWFLLSLFISNEIKGQWLKNSFVANSIETATNFNDQVYESVDWSLKNTLCISGLGGSESWAVYTGHLIEILSKKNVEIIQVDPKKEISKKCKIIDAVNVLHDGRSFFVKFIN